VEGERNNKIGVAIVGAGQVGAILAEDLLYNPSSHYYPVCFIDKDKNKIGNRVCGINVIDESDDVIEKIKKLPVQEIFIALTNLTAERATEIHSRYAKTGCKIKLYDIPVVEAENTDGKRVIREVKIEDLLFRDSIKVADDKTKEFYLNKPIESMASCHIEYDFKKRGDAIDIATLENTWFVFPLTATNILTKIHFAVEELYKFKKDDIELFEKILNNKEDVK
jgi:hypothetical protein